MQNMDVELDWDFPSDNDEEIVDFIAADFFNRRVLERSNHFETMREEDFVRRYRLSKCTILDLLSKIEHKLDYGSDRNNSVSPINQILCTLRFYATGSQLITCGDVINIHESSACRIVHRVTDAIARLYPQYITFPTTEEEQNRTVTEFYNIAHFPRAIGAVDCTFVRINSPGGENAELYRCRNGYFAINVQGICNANLEFTDLVARWHGSANDSNIWDNCAKKRNFLQNIYNNKLLLGDSQYAQTPYMMTPYDRVRSREEALYNDSQIRSRNVIERTFGAWKRRFPILGRGIQLQLRRVPGIIVATAVLHNLARRQGEEEPPEDPEFPLPAEVEDLPLTDEEVRARRARLRNTGLLERQILVEQHFTG